MPHKQSQFKIVDSYNLTEAEVMGGWTKMIGLDLTPLKCWHSTFLWASTASFNSVNSHKTELKWAWPVCTAGPARFGSAWFGPLLWDSLPRHVARTCTCIVHSSTLCLFHALCIKLWTISRVELFNAAKQIKNICPLNVD